MSSGPLTDGALGVAQTPESGRKHARDAAKVKSSPASATREDADGGDITARLLKALEAQVEISKE